MTFANEETLVNEEETPCESVRACVHFAIQFGREGPGLPAGLKEHVDGCPSCQQAIEADRIAREEWKLMPAGAGGAVPQGEDDVSGPASKLANRILRFICLLREPQVPSFLLRVELYLVHRAILECEGDIRELPRALVLLAPHAKL